MKSLPLLRVSLCFLLVAPAWGQGTETPTLTVSQLIQQLEQYESQVHQLSETPQNTPNVVRSLPKEMRIHSSRGELTVSTEFLRAGLVRFQLAAPNVRPQLLNGLEQRLAAMRAEAEAYEQPSRADDAARARLKQILSAREFSRIHGPTALELLQNRISAWFYRHLNRLSPHIPEISNLGQLAIWIVIAAASSILAIRLYRMSKERLAGPREILPFLPSQRSWNIWLRDAQERASLGEWRDAVHSAFWAGVSRLESDGVWRPDKARTPREYLNAIPASSRAKSPFTALMSKFEAIWYGGRPSSAGDFAQCLTDLEKLGCR